MLNKTYQLESCGISDIGLVREHNEDAWAAYPDIGLFVLADGMGGHLGGEIASKEAIETLHALVKRWHLSKDCSVDRVKELFQEAYSYVNAQIYDRGEQNEDLRGMGTTLCSLYFLKGTSFLAHVGDSRIYRLRHVQLEQLTEDHSLVTELLALGAMRPDEAETFPYRHILTRAIGTQPKIEVTIQSYGVEPHDVFMLCSDGLTNYATHEQLQKILAQPGSLEERGSALVRLALTQGGGDNVTVILIEIQ